MRLLIYRVYSYQDTLLAEQGNQYYGFGYIEGAVDFIWGQHARAFFQKNTIASVGPGTITADGPDSKTDGLCRYPITDLFGWPVHLTGLSFLSRHQFSECHSKHCGDN